MTHAPKRGNFGARWQPAGAWLPSAGRERSGDTALVGAFEKFESGVVLRVPPHSKVSWDVSCLIPVTPANALF